MKTEAVIGWVVFSFFIGFIGGVGFGVYKSGPIVDPHQSHGASDINEQQQEAINEFLEKTSQNPDDSNAWVQLGHLYFDNSRFEEAVGAYEKALAIDPKNVDVWTDLGVMHRRNGHPEKAVEAFDKVMELDAAHENSRFNKGVVLFYDLKDEEGALIAWGSLLAINPDAKSPNGQTVRELVDHIKSGHQETK